MCASRAALAGDGTDDRTGIEVLGRISLAYGGDTLGKPVYELVGDLLSMMVREQAEHFCR